MAITPESVTILDKGLELGNKLCDGAGLLFAPYLIKSRAEAEASSIRIIAASEAEASITKAEAQAKHDTILAESKIHITDLQRRATQRWLTEESIKQDNLENIILKALPNLLPNAQPKNISNDWILRFSDKAKFASEDYARELWAKTLATEANNPNTFSKRSIDILSRLERKDITLFNSLLSFSCTIQNYKTTPIIIEHNAPIYINNNLSFDSLEYLEELGLVQHESAGFVVNYNKDADIIIAYNNTYISLKTQPAGLKHKIPYGMISLTKAGNELSKLASPHIIPEFIQFLFKAYESKGHSVLLNKSPERV